MGIHQIGQYRLVRQLASGGMGQLFKAEDVRTGQPVAIKLIKGPLAGNEAARMRFVREARAAGQLRHRNICGTYDIGQIQGALYMVQEYLSGAPLSALVSQSAGVPMRKKLEMAAEICDALGYAHRHGIVHRDLKPSNIFVSRDGTAKIIDFGLAEFANLSNSLVQGGGTPLYMSPEQLGGEKLDGRSDIWSAGATFYELLTGALAYHSVREITSGPPPVVPRHIPLAAELNRLLARMLAKDRTQRFATAEEVAAELRKLQQALDSADQVTIINPDSQPSGNLSVSSLGPSSSGGTVPPPPPSVQQPALQASTGQAPMRSAAAPAPAPSQGYAGLDVGLDPGGRGRVDYREEVCSSRARGVALPRIIPTGAVGLALALLAGTVVGVVKLALWAVDSLQRRPRCRHCHLWMIRVSRWERFVTSTSEIVQGYRDCVAALKENLWEDAAKLLCVHGSHQAAVYTCIRYSLEYFECAFCADQAARLSAADLVNSKWMARERHGIAYRAGSDNPALQKAGRLAHSLSVLKLALLKEKGVRSAESVDVLAPKRGLDWALLGRVALILLVGIFVLRTVVAIARFPRGTPVSAWFPTAMEEIDSHGYHLFRIQLQSSSGTFSARVENQRLLATHPIIYFVAESNAGNAVVPTVQQGVVIRGGPAPAAGQASGTLPPALSFYQTSKQFGGGTSYFFKVLDDGHLWSAIENTRVVSGTIPTTLRFARYWLVFAVRNPPALTAGTAVQPTIKAVTKPMTLQEFLAAHPAAIQRPYFYGKATYAGGYRMDGKLIAQDHALAAQLFRLASDKADPYAENSLAYLEEIGDGVPKDPSAAVSLYEKAAKDGSIEAEVNLGRLYENGIGVTKDLKRAIEWYRLGAKDGDVTAAHKVKELSRRSNTASVSRAK